MNPAAFKKVQIMSTFFDRFGYKSTWNDTKIKRFLRIACFWGLFSPGGALRDCQRQDKNVVYLYLFFDTGISCGTLFCIGFCKKYQALYPIG